MLNNFNALIYAVHVSDETYDVNCSVDIIHFYLANANKTTNTNNVNALVRK